MSSQLSNLSGTLPPVGTPAIVPGTLDGVGQPPPPPGSDATTATGGGATTDAGTSAEDQQVIAILQTLVSTLNQLVAIHSARLGAATITGGGATTPTSAPVYGEVVVGGDSMRLAASGSGGGLGGGASWNGAFTLVAHNTGVGSVLGGGGGSTGSQQVSGALGTPTLGGGNTGAAWTIVPITSPIAPTGATTLPLNGAPAAAPAVAGATGAPTIGGGAAAAPAATPQVDMRRMTGTPDPNGVIALALQRASGTATAARSEGQYIVLSDANGAQLQAHVHGTWASAPDRIADGIRQGLIQVHVHPDGTLHLHDVA